VSLSRTVFIDRADHKGALAAFQAAAQNIRNERQSVYIFPEGTRSYYDKPDLLPFKKGAFHLAIQAQVPIVPLVSANYSNILSFKKKIFRSGTIPVQILEPISTEGLTAADVEDLMKRVRNVMLEALIKLSHSYELSNGATTAPGLKEKTKIALSS
jgi:lysophosphatidate acyltransferase